MEAGSMRESIRLFVAAEGHSSKTVDAAPGIEPSSPQPTPRAVPEDPAPSTQEKTRWVLTVRKGYNGQEFWSTDRALLERFAKLRGYKDFTIGQPIHGTQIPAEWMTTEPSPRHLSIENLPLDSYEINRFLSAGVHTLGDMAAMSLEQFRYYGFKPQDYRPVQQGLLRFGMKMSFDLFPGEQRGWSPKRNLA
jgi:hypothetical protein